jgi:hypothetical protein
MSDSGIILKILSEKCSLLILDSLRGKILCKINNRTKLINGSHINYTLEKNRNNFYLKESFIKNDPFKVAKFDILFFHQILEITNYFLPLESPNNEIYKLLSFFFNNYELLNISNKKKLYLCKLLSLLGIYPDIKEAQLTFFKLISFPIDIIANLEIDLNIEPILDFWIDSAIECHPYYTNFKAIKISRF